MFDGKLIRNFGIIAHVDHGKSTPADRTLVAAKAVSAREMRTQSPDDTDVKRERDIAVKANPATVFHDRDGQEYRLSLVDTPTTQRASARAAPLPDPFMWSGGPGR